MARNFRISVNGRSYDVVVEEMGQSAVSAPAAPQPVFMAPAAPAAPAPQAVAAPAPDPVAAPAAPAPEPAKAPVTGGTKITSPMPGKIWKMHVKEGDVVSEGQLVLVLEAMKMENEIFAPAGGTVAQVCFREGDSVNTDDVLVVIA